MLYNSMKCHENASNGFQVIDRIRNGHSPVSKEITPKHV